MHKFWKERRRNPWNSRGCFECSYTTHFITDCPKRKKYDYCNKNDYNNKNDYKRKNRFGDKKKKNIKKIISWACVALSNFDFSSEDSSSSEEDEKVNCKKKEGDFTELSSWPSEDSSSSEEDENFNCKKKEGDFTELSSWPREDLHGTTPTGTPTLM
jgi:hypothetical protein